MPKESIGEPASTLEMGAQLPDLAGIQAHHTIKRKLGFSTSGMTYYGLHNSAEEAEATRQANIVKAWLGTKKIDGRWVGITHDQADEMSKKWLSSTEVVELKVDEHYSPHGLPDAVHGQTDGATH